MDFFVGKEGDFRYNLLITNRIANFGLISAIFIIDEDAGEFGMRF